MAAEIEPTPRTAHGPIGAGPVETLEDSSSIVALAGALPGRQPYNRGAPVDFGSVIADLCDHDSAPAIPFPSGIRTARGTRALSDCDGIKPRRGIGCI